MYAWGAAPLAQLADHKRSRYKVQYDDGDKRWHDLEEEEWEWLDDLPCDLPRDQLVGRGKAKVQVLTAVPVYATDQAAA